MLDAEINSRSVPETEQQLFYSPDLQRLLQSLLTTLADLDFDYEQERERVETSTKDPALKARLLRKLAERHRARREPYIRHLTILQDRIMPIRST
jgi:hypothetical protein